MTASASVLKPTPLSVLTTAPALIVLVLPVSKLENVTLPVARASVTLIPVAGNVCEAWTSIVNVWAGIVRTFGSGEAVSAWAKTTRDSGPSRSDRGAIEIDADGRLV
jgi:hypothetical protein